MMLIMETRNLALCFLFFATVHGFYLPGLAPNVFCRNPTQDSKCKVRWTKFPITRVNCFCFLVERGSLCQSTRFSGICSTLWIFLVNSIYVDNAKSCCLMFSFDFCGITDEKSPVENLGQVLFGERIRPSPYKVCWLSCSCPSSFVLFFLVQFSQAWWMPFSLYQEILCRWYHTTENAETFNERNDPELSTALDRR